MAYKDIHEMPYRSGIKEKFFSIGNFSLSLGESGWMALGLIISYQMSKYISVLPFSFPFSHIHYAIPVAITYFLSKAKHPRTGLALSTYLIRWYAIRRRNRVFYYRKSNIIEGGDRYQ